jgi:hypothetical protein
VVGWVRDIQPPVKGAANNSIYYSFPALLKDTLTDTVSTPQIVHFEAHSAVTISGKNCLGSSALAAVNVYPSCSLWAADVIGVHPANDSICPGGTATLTADTLPCAGGTRYLWSSGDTTRSISKTTGGTYTVTATNTCGCSATASGVIVVKPNPTVSVNNDTVCAGTTAILTASGGSTYSWNTGSTNDTIHTNVGGTYTVTATNIYGCSAAASGTVSYLANPTPTVTSDTVCAGTMAMLTASGGVSYLWSTGSTASTITTTAAGTYTVTATNSFGCSATASGMIVINALPIPAVNSDTVCAGLLATLTAIGGVNYLWSTGAATASITTSSAGTYTVAATNSYGCSAVATGTVVLKSTPTPLVNNDTVCAGSIATLAATGGLSYLWSTGDTVSIITEDTEGTY